MNNMDELLSGLEVEQKRGTLTLAVLSQLTEPQYGYSLLERLQQAQVPIEAGTLYPLLRRLEKQEILESRWDTGEARPRKYYILSKTGETVYNHLCQNWRSTVTQMNALLEMQTPEPIERKTTLVEGTENGID